MKICKSCNAVKPMGDFYAHPRNRDGRSGVCKECHKKRMFEARRDNPKVRERDRERAKRPERRAKATAITKLWRAENPDAYRAQNAVNNAIRDGKLSRDSCAMCGEKKAHAHHKNYLKPLDVIWLCARCHHRVHHIFALEGANKRGAEP